MYDRNEGPVEEKDYVRQVPDQLDQPGTSQETLEKAILELEKKLKPILRDDLIDHNNQTENKKEPVKLVPIALIVKERRLHAQAMIAKVNFLCKEIQI